MKQLFLMANLETKICWRHLSYQFILYLQAPLRSQLIFPQSLSISPSHVQSIPQTYLFDC